MGERIWRGNANTDEAKIGGTSPAGQFSPQGGSHYGCADMIGNVWEWCSNWFNKKEGSGHKVSDKACLIVRLCSTMYHLVTM